MEKELEALTAQNEKEKQTIATMKTTSLQKAEVINSLTRGIEEWRQKVADLKEINANLGQEISQKAQEIMQLLVDNKSLKDRKEYLETAIAKVEMRAQMELILEYKDGKHLS